MKSAIKKADDASKAVLLRALIAMSYAHWEGYVRVCANTYFEYLTLRKMQYSELERQIYVNSFLVRLGAMSKAPLGIEARCRLVNDILDGKEARFGYIDADLIDTRSNLNTDAIKDICLICGVEDAYFEDRRPFIDVIVLRRRNAIAHGKQEYISTADIDDLVADTLALMQHFRSLLENKVYMRAYMAV